MSSPKTKDTFPRWQLFTAITCSLITLLFITAVMRQSFISAAPDIAKASTLQTIETNQSTSASHTILVGLVDGTTTEIASGLASRNGVIDLITAVPGVTSAKSLLSFEDTAVSTTATNISSRLGQIYKLQLEPEADMAATIRQLEANPAILFAEPDYLAHLITTPNDPLFAGQWGLTKINAPTAWDITTGSSNVVIAVIDSGIDISHPDLAGQLWSNPGEIAGNGIDDDNNGHIDDIHGWNMVDENANLSDNTGHGTEVAGIIGAISDNGQGVAGLCWNCQLMVLKVTQPGGVANYSDIIEAIHYAALKGADVINLSLGGSSDSVSLRLAVEEAAATAVVVGGAGNNNNNTPFYPAAYESVLAVAGTTTSDTKVGSSSYGSWVDVAAPGEAITTTFDGSSYGVTSGTSMAAPFAAGLAGLLRSAHPDWSADTARAQMIQTATAVDTLNPGYEGLLGSGRIDAAQSLVTAAQPDLYYVNHEVDGVVNGRPEPGSTIDLNITLSNDWADAANVQATLNSTDSYVTIVNNTASYDAIDTFNNAANLTPFRITVSGSAPYAHELALTLSVTADGGYGTAVPITITTASSTEYVSGLITADTTWSNDKQYIMTGNILVQTGITLTIEAGTTIKVDPGYILRVDGSLLAYGTETTPVLFTSNKTEPAHSDWVGIEINDEGLGNLSYCEISYSETAVKLLGNNPKATIHHCYIHHNRDGIQGADYRTLLITENYIAHNYVRGILFPGTDAEIHRNEIAYNGGDGIHASANGNVGLVTENLIHHNGTSNWDSGYGIYSGPGTVLSNTIVYNKLGAGFEDPNNTVFRNNNVWGNTIYDMKNSYVGGQPFDATNNWWGTTDTSLIDQNIYDLLDNLDRAITNYTPFLTEPEPTAPGYLNNLEISPESPIGIETATFNLQFSRPMDQSINPDVQMHWLQSGTVMTYTTANSGILDNSIRTLAIDFDDNKWFAGHAGVSQLKQDGTWRTYTPSNSGLASTSIGATAVDTANNKWFGSSNGYGNEAVVSKLAQNGTWATYNNTGLTDSISHIVPDEAGNIWLASTWNVAKLNTNQTWTMYSFYPNYVLDIAIDTQNNIWFALDQQGVKVLSPTGEWNEYTTSNSELIGDRVYSIAVDQDDNKWIGTNMGINLLTADGSWTQYLSIYGGVISVRNIDFDSKGNVWFTGRYDGQGGVGYHIGRIMPGEPVNYNDWSWDYIQLTEEVNDLEVDSSDNIWLATNGASVILREVNFSIDNNDGQWMNNATWQANFDVNALVPRGTYSITVSAAQGTDGLEIIPDMRFGFTVDYAGEITDQTPPEPPFALAGGIAGDASGFEALWFANDADSSVTGYRYALGSAPGATDIINWTATSETSVRLSGLGLTAGQQYWLVVQARNSGGLWSASAYSGFVAGQPLSRVFLPSVIKP